MFIYEYLLILTVVEKLWKGEDIDPKEGDQFIQKCHQANKLYRFLVIILFTTRKLMSYQSERRRQHEVQGNLRGDYGWESKQGQDKLNKRE